VTDAQKPDWIGEPIPPEGWRGQAPPTLPQVMGSVDGCFMCGERRYHDDGHKTF
jgi:hypothetical protein